MTEGKKQKAMLGVLAALLVGMGGVYWFVLREGDAGGNDMAMKAGSQKVKREKRASTKTKKQRASRSGRSSAERAEKVTREKTERTSKKKSRRGKGRSKIKKKKKIHPPAAYLPPKDDWLEDFDPNSFHPRLT